MRLKSLIWGWKWGNMTDNYRSGEISAFGHFWTFCSFATLFTTQLLFIFCSFRSKWWLISFPWIKKSLVYYEYDWWCIFKLTYFMKLNTMLSSIYNFFILSVSLFWLFWLPHKAHMKLERIELKYLKNIILNKV